MELNYRKLRPSERLKTIVAGDPVGDYFGFPDVQQMILAEEQSDRSNTSSSIIGAAEEVIALAGLGAVVEQGQR